ncbi:MAG TPA: glycosyltransferase family 39 protein, partial [Acidimicrobiales bacterium]
MTQSTDVTERAAVADQPEATEGSDAPTALRLLLRLVIVLALAVGVGLHLWYLFHSPINSDESIVGLMARDILHGHFVAFYWGQPYGGGEPYVVAVLFALFGQSALTLSMAPLLLAAVAAVLVWRVACRVASPALAALAGALAWLGPDVMTANATREYGFRGVTLVCGLACLLFALRLLDRGPSWVDCAGLGLATGVGWWSSPEIAYFLIPAGLVVVGALRVHASSATSWLNRLALAVIAFAVGSLPWIWANVNSHGASLKPSNFPGGAVSSLNTGFGARLEIFFRLSLLIDLDLRRLVTGGYLVSGAPGVALAVVVLTALAGSLVA